MIHGTGSQAHTGFASLPRPYLEGLHQAYGGRVFALDHPTISVTPEKNIEWFFSQVPDGSNLDLDIVCHSRGGLVARVLAEKQSEFSLGSRAIRVNKIIFVAAPNAGTILTDANYMSDYLDSYTNLLNFFPDTAVLDTLQAVIAVAKQLAVGAFKGLDGLESMLPTGSFLQWLNVGARTRGGAGPRYFALASNYEPTQPGLKLWAQNRLLDDIFKADNDMVVPTAGVYAGNGAASFPIDEHVVFDQSRGVPHSGYFANEDARTQITDWLNRN
jgi:pimeloyl-ACP methyl ester carboxylesterase